MHKSWKDKQLGLVIGEKGYAAIEIDESGLIDKDNNIYWMFGIIGRFTKEARIFCMLDLLPRVLVMLIVF